MQTAMKAAWFEEFGPAADVLRTGEQPTPALETGQVLVRLETSGINPSDVKKRAGAFPDLLDDGLVIPHSDGVWATMWYGGEIRCDRLRPGRSPARKHEFRSRRLPWNSGYDRA